MREPTAGVSYENNMLYAASDRACIEDIYNFVDNFRIRDRSLPSSNPTARNETNGTLDSVDTFARDKSRKPEGVVEISRFPGCRVRFSRKQLSLRLFRCVLIAFKCPRVIPATA